MSANLLPAATALATAALSVIPADASNKKPSLKWGPYQAQAATVPEVTAWFTPNGHTPPTAIAVICGAVSGGLTVLDFDTLPGGATLYEEWAGIVEAAMPGLLARLPVVATPSGGRHVYLRCAVCEGNAKLAEGARRETWIETRGEGGYVLAPVTPGYRTLQGTLKAIPTLEPAERALLLTAARTLTKYVPVHGAHLDTDSLPGAAFNAKHTTADMRRWLEGAGWLVAGEHADGTTLLRRPGKRGGISATLGQGGLRSLYVFSSNAAPFEPNQGYSAFAVHTLLEHGGDYAASARQLAQDGYGGRKPKGVENPVSTPLAGDPLLKSGQNGQGVEGVEVLKNPEPWCIRPPAHTLLRFSPSLFLAPTLVRYVEAAASIMDMPVEFFAAPLLSVLSVGVGATARMRVTGTYQEVPLLWTCAVGDPGSGKTPSAEKITEPLHAIERESYLAWKEATRTYEAELAEWQEGEKGYRGPRPTMPTYKKLLTSDVTIEALVPILERTPRGVLLEKDELAGWIKSFNQYKKQGGSDREHWLSIWSAKSFMVDRKQDHYSVYVDRPFVAVTGGIQPHKLAPMLADVEDGFSDRILFFWPPTKPLESRDHEIPAGVAADYRALVAALLDLGFDTDTDGKSVPYICGRTPDAYAYYKERQDGMQRRAHDADTPTRLRTAYAKMGAQAARIACLLHFAQFVDNGQVDPLTVDLRTMQAAWEIADVSCSHLERIHFELSSSVASSRALKAVAWLGKHGGGATIRELLQGKVCGIATSSEARALMESIADRHLGVLTMATAGGWEQARIALPTGEGAENG